MTHALLAATAVLPLCLSPAATRADATGQSGPVAEIVTFRLAAGTSDAAFLAAAQGTAAPLAARPGFLVRRLSRDETGLWTDYVEWTDLPAAQAAAEHLMADPAFGPFMAAIDPQGMVMRHATTLWTQGD
jgi:hypothetical protein